MAEEIGSLEIQISASVNKANASLDELCKKLDIVNSKLMGTTKTAGTFLSNLNSNAKGIKGNFSKFHTSLENVNRLFARTNKSTDSFITGFKGIAKGIIPIALLTKGVKELQESILSTADYIETYNYYNVALGKVASEWNKEFAKYGYENAQAYGDSFTERLSQTLGKLSGVKLELDSEGKGLLSESGMKNLGMNIQEVTQYASQLVSVTNSLGLTGESSLAISSSFTKLAGDISSLFNIDYSSVSKNLQSGLIGQSRALYKYGIDITNATLQTYAYNLGLSKAVSEMTQAEKMQLRMIAILDQSKVSWGDLANTINSPSNMIRQFTNNLKETGMVLGQLFIPLLQKVLPVINGVTIAMKRLFVNIAGFLGVKVDLDSFGQGYTDLEDSIDDITGAYDDAAGAAKKFKTITLGIDELNINAPQTESGSVVSGGGSIDLTDEILKATEEYEKVWNAAYEKMENKATGIADKIQKLFSDICKPISSAWITEGDYVKSAWTDALNSIGSLAATVGNDIMAVWQQDNTVKIFENILGIIGDIGYSIANLAKNFEEAWSKNETGKKILENIRDMVLIITSNIRTMSTATVEWTSNLNFSPLLEAFERLTAKLSESRGMIDSVSGIISDFYTTVLLPLGTWTIEKGLPDLLDVMTRFADSVDWQGLRGNLSELWTHLEPFAETVGEGLIIFIDDISQGLANFVNSESFENFLTSIENWMDNVKPSEVASGLKAICTAIIGFKAVSAVTAGLAAVERFLSIWGVGKGAAIAGEMTATASGITALSTALASMGGISGMLTMDLGTILGAGTAAEIGTVAGSAIIGGIVAAFAGWNFGQFLNEQITGEEIDLSFTEQMKEIKNSFTDGSWKGALELWGKDISDGLSAIGDDVNKWMEDTFGDWAGTTFTDLFDGIKQWWDIDVVGALDLWGKDIDAWFNENVSPWFSLEKWTELLGNILLAAQTKWAEITEWWNGTAIVTWWDESVSPWFSLDTWLTLLDNIKTSFSTKWTETSTQWVTNITTWWNTNVSPWFTKKKWDDVLSKIPTAFKDAFKAAANGAIGFLNGVIGGVEDMVNNAIQALVKMASVVNKIPGVDVQFDAPHISFPKIPQFEVGGFPEDGLFMANHNELVGQFSNGRTAVANNEMITAGIEEAAYRGFARAYAENSREADLLVELIEAVREGKTIAIDGRELVSAIDERNKRNGFSFA